MSEATKKGSKKVRMNVTFGPRYYEMLDDLATTSGTTKADIIRDAIAFQEWLREVEEEGGRILVERKDGELAEVVRT